jgi:hypothetical protein
VTDGNGDGEVDADEGFWAGAGRARVWVRFTDTGESPPTVTPASRVSLTGGMVPNPPGSAARTGATATEGGDQLTGRVTTSRSTPAV